MQRTRAAIGAGAVALVFGVVTIAVSWSAASGTFWLDTGLRLWGVLGVVVGVVVWMRAPHPRLGRLMVVTATLWHLNFLRGSTQPVVFAIGFCGAFAWTAGVAHLLYTWPTGRATTRTARVLVPIGYVAAVATQILAYVVDHPSAPRAFGTSQPRTVAAGVGSAVFAVLTGIMVVVMGVRWFRANRMRRRSAEPIWAYVIAAGTAGVAVSLIALLDLPTRAETTLMLATMVISLPVVPIIYLVQRNRSRAATWRVARVALQLEESAGDPAPARLERSLAHAVGDPTLRLLYPETGGGFVDGDGHPRAPLPGPGSGRAVTPVERRGHLVALIEHDEAFADEHAVAEAAGAAAGLALENARLYATLHAQIGQLQESRLRIATSATSERRRIQRDLHDGAQQELFAVLILLDMARSRAGDDDPAAPLVRRAHRQLADAIGSLRRLTEGIYPVALVEHGLVRAVESLVDRSPIAVTVDTDESRHRPEIETTAYFVVAEALGNVYKHAAAAFVSLTLRCDAGTFAVRISDDGIGGADPAGTGLRALADRVSTVGGRLTVEPGPAGGTVVVATFPTGDPCSHERSDQSCVS